MYRPRIETAAYRIGNGNTHYSASVLLEVVVELLVAVRPIVDIFPSPLTRHCAGLNYRVI
jgi:hypothetical protein